MAKAKYYVKLMDGDSVNTEADDFGHDIEAGVTHFWVGLRPGEIQNANVPLTVRTDQIKQIIREEIASAS
jgi:hypothetical protein